MPQAPSFEPFEYILKNERDLSREKQTIFLLRPLRYQQAMEAERNKIRFVNQTPELEVGELGMARKVLNYGLEGWTNFSGVPDFKRENGKALPEEILDTIMDYAIELANAVEVRGKLQEAEAKNS